MYTVPEGLLAEVVDTSLRYVTAAIDSPIASAVVLISALRQSGVSVLVLTFEKVTFEKKDR